MDTFQGMVGKTERERQKIAVPHLSEQMESCHILKF